MSTTRLAPSGIAGVCLAIGLAACGSSPSQTTPPNVAAGGCSTGTAGVSNLGVATVKVTSTDQLLFSPTTQAAHLGQVVEWTAPGTTTHTITFQSSDASCLSDAQLLPGATWEVKFTQAGTYAYKCTVHPGMNGTITVSP